jgi:WD40 repeat protein
LVAAGLDNGRLQVWDATSASATMIDLVAHGEPIEWIDASSDGKWLLTGDIGGTIKLWTLFTTAELLKASEIGQLK